MPITAKSGLGKMKESRGKKVSVFVGQMVCATPQLLQWEHISQHLQTDAYGLYSADP